MYIYQTNTSTTVHQQHSLNHGLKPEIKLCETYTPQSKIMFKCLDGNEFY